MIGNIIISANKEFLGTIIYINEIGAQILRGRITDIIGNKIEQYIPTPYNLGHYEKMKNFIDNCTCPEVDKQNT